MPNATSLLIVAALVGATVLAQPPASKLTKADIDKMMKELSNWGRWGKTDEKGTVNLITAAKRKAAVAEVRDGFPVSMARNTDSHKGVDNSSPFVLKMSPPVDNQFNMDEYTVFFHGFAHTHLDALSHVFYQGKMYNGFPESAVKPDGTGALGVTAFSDGFLTRGVLVDIPALKNLPYLEPGTVIYPADLDAWERKTGVHVQSGDAVFIRTGRWAYREAKGPWDIGGKAAGLSPLCARWLKQRDISILGSDAAHDVLPSGIPGVTFPVHQLLLVAMGAPLLDQCDLEPVAKEAAKRNRSTFLFTAASIRVTGGTGAPINPIATF
jgi:kynurenine formamidase